MGKVQVCDLFIQMARKEMDLLLHLLSVLPELDLRQNLIAERSAHDKTGVPGGVVQFERILVSVGNRSERFVPKVMQAIRLVEREGWRLA